MLKSILKKLKLFMINPASIKFEVSGRLYNISNSFNLIFHNKRRVKCNICGWEGNRFLAIVGPNYVRYNAICPVCGSAERNRGLIEYMNEREMFKTGINCLDIAPIESFSTYFRNKGCNYISLDLDSDLAMVKSDITQLGFFDNTFDLIICSHVLEHVKDDLKAIKEMFRVLKSKGVLFIMVPFNKNRLNTIEYEAPNPLDYPNHVRNYGLDIMNRIKSCGFRVEMVDLLSEVNKKNKNAIDRLGLGIENILFLCTKGNNRNDKEYQK